MVHTIPCSNDDLFPSFFWGGGGVVVIKQNGDILDHKYNILDVVTCVTGEVAQQ